MVFKNKLSKNNKYINIHNSDKIISLLSQRGFDIDVYYLSGRVIEIGFRTYIKEGCLKEDISYKVLSSDDNDNIYSLIVIEGNNEKRYSFTIATLYDVLSKIGVQFVKVRRPIALKNAKYLVSRLKTARANMEVTYIKGRIAFIDIDKGDRLAFISKPGLYTISEPYQLRCSELDSRFVYGHAMKILDILKYYNYI